MIYKFKQQKEILLLKLISTVHNTIVVQIFKYWIF